MIELEKGKTGLGLSLAGNRDRSRMSVFVVGIDPNGAAGRDGRMVVGDELLEVRRVPTGDPNSREMWCLGFYLVLRFFTPTDQWASPLWPQSPECIVHHQELCVKSQNHLYQVQKHFLSSGYCFYTYTTTELQFDAPKNTKRRKLKPGVIHIKGQQRELLYSKRGMSLKMTSCHQKHEK